MKKKKILFKGQSLLEYAVLIAVIGMALLSSQAYVRRAIQGRWKQAMDNVGDQYDYWLTYSNIYLYSESNTTSNITLIGTTNAGWQQRTDETNEIWGRYGNETVAGTTSGP